jgi:hypothetical protein
MEKKLPHVMKVKVNRRNLEIFEGARARHALLKYFRIRKFDLALVEQVAVFDAYGHPIDLDAPLSEGMTIKYKFQ